MSIMFVLLVIRSRNTDRANTVNEQVGTHQKRSERNRLLAETDWTQVSDSLCHLIKKTEWV